MSNYSRFALMICGILLSSQEHMTSSGLHEPRASNINHTYYLVVLLEDRFNWSMRVPCFFCLARKFAIHFLLSSEGFLQLAGEA